MYMYTKLIRFKIKSELYYNTPNSNKCVNASQLTCFPSPAVNTYFMLHDDMNITEKSRISIFWFFKIPQMVKELQWFKNAKSSI